MTAVKDTAALLIPRESGVEALTAFFPLDRDRAEKIIGTSGTEEFNPALPESSASVSVDVGAEPSAVPSADSESLEAP